VLARGVKSGEFCEEWLEQGTGVVTAAKAGLPAGVCVGGGYLRARFFLYSLYSLGPYHGQKEYPDRHVTVPDARVNRVVPQRHWAEPLRSVPPC